VNGTAGSAPPEPATVFTVGHSNHDPEPFLALLAQHGIRTIVDVRSTPSSRYVPHFGRDPLCRLLEGVRLRYVWLGDLLGGRPDDPDCYGSDGQIDYAAVARQPWYQEGVDMLLREVVAAPTAILCSEEDPRRCHRHRLIEPSLRARDAIVLHIRREGTLETIAPAAPDAVPAAQLMLGGFAA
jgi:uncharacterized protein (DUF488 family)